MNQSSLASVVAVWWSLSPPSCTASTVRLPLQSATPPHWVNSPMAVRAISAPACHRRTARRLPNRIQIVFWRAATFIQLLAWVDIKMHKAVEAWKQKKIRINNMHTLHIFIQYGIYFWHELAYTLHYILIKLNWNICGTSAYFLLTLTCIAYLNCT